MAHVCAPVQVISHSELREIQREQHQHHSLVSMNAVGSASAQETEKEESRLVKTLSC